MAKLDRLGWAAGVAFTCHGARMGIRVTDEEALHEIISRLPPGWRATSRPIVDELYSVVVGGQSRSANVQRYHLLYDGAMRLARTHNLEELFDLLESTLHFTVAIRARKRLFVHAGVVGWGDRAILIPGRSQTGKTTLTASLLRAGGTYFSDEYAVLDSEGYVHPYPKPLSIRTRTSERPLRQRAKELDARTGTRKLPVGLVVVTEYREGAAWRPRRLPTGEAALALLQNTLMAQVNPKLALEIVQRAMQQASALKGARGEADQAVPAILKHVSATSQAMEIEH